MPGGVAGIPVEYTERKRKRKRKSAAANAKRKSWRKGGRPTSGEGYVVHRIAELIRVADAIRDNQKWQRDGVTLVMADGRAVNINSLDEIVVGVGRFFCRLNPEYRPYVLRLLANVLEGEAPVPDDLAKIRAAWREAKAELKGLYKGDDPTFAEVGRKYHKRHGCRLDRRALSALRKAGCPCRPDKLGIKKNCHDPEVTRNRGNE